jgi:succinyl-CoA synthetase alpha subunit
MGADPVVLLNLEDILALFEQDAGTDAVIIVGEVGGDQEEKAAGVVGKMSKPVAVYIAGRFSPQGKRMGHAGAIVRGEAGTVAGKHEAMKAARATILESPIHATEWARKLGLK